MSAPFIFLSTLIIRPLMLASVRAQLPLKVGGRERGSREGGGDIYTLLKLLACCPSGFGSSRYRRRPNANTMEEIKEEQVDPSKCG
jgi:hypothetical protein